MTYFTLIVWIVGHDPIIIHDLDEVTCHAGMAVMANLYSASTSCIQQLSRTEPLDERKR